MAATTLSAVDTRSTDVVVAAALLPLQGWTVAVTGSDRGLDVVRLLHQRGARVLHVAAVQVVPLEDDTVLRTATAECLARPFDIVVATTGIGFAAWLEAADGWGSGEELRRALTAARVYARGPKASGAVYAAGLHDVASPACESTWDILERLLSDDLAGSRVVVQLHGADLGDFTRTLRTAGAEVVEVPVYRTVPPHESGPLDRLVEQILAREVHAVTFTSAAAVSNLLDAAGRNRALDDLLDAFGEVLPVCVGGVAAAPLERLSVTTVQPDRARIGALVHVLTSALESRAVRVRAAGHDLEVRGAGAVVDGCYRPVPPAPMAALRALARQPGRVLSPALLQQGLPGGGDEHAAEMAVSRLRAALGDPRCVRNVVKRGYSLACDLDHPESGELALDEAPDGPDGLDAAPPPAPLLTSVGGRPGIREAVERLYARLLADPSVSQYFDGVDMPRLKRHQVLLLSQMLGGPAQYSGRDLAAAHADLHIRSADYRCVVEHLVAVLGELDVPVDAVGTIRAALEALETHVVS
jgi:uroporphyrinogen-III synthase